MKKNLIYLFLLNTILFGFDSGGYDNGSLAGKNNLDMSITWNPNNYFKNGQSYIVLGYGLTNKIDAHAYFSYRHNGNSNYYGGFCYQIYKSNYIDIATAFGIRKYFELKETHIFFPQLLFTYHLTSKLSIGGSSVQIRRSENFNNKIGNTLDLFFIFKIYENKKYKIDFTTGMFRPALWKPNYGDWYPTYSFEVKIK